MGFKRLAVLSLVLTASLAPWAWAQQQPAQAVNNQDEQVNIVVSPPPPDGVSAISILRTDDFTDQNDYVSEVFELETDPFEVLPYVRSLVQQEGGAAEGFVYADPETGEISRFIQVVCPDYQMDSVRAVLAVVNRAGAQSDNGGTRLHYRMHHQLASSVAAILNRTEISPDGFVQADDVTNTIYIRDSKSDGARALAAAQFYDVPARMVELRVQIVEVDVTDSETIGLDWDAWKTSAAGFLALTSASRDGLGGEFISFDSLLVIDATALAEFLNYLVHVGHATTLTDTSLTVVNGQTATLQSTKAIPHQVYTTQNGADPIRFVDEGDTSDPEHVDFDGLAMGPLDEPAGRAVLRDQFDAQEGFRLVFSPIIGTDSMVCHVLCEINNLAGQSDLDTPIVASHRTETMIGLSDGGTCLVGAFDRTTAMDVQDGLPLLRHIPVLGPSLFSETTEELRRTKLVVLVTPRIDANLTYTPEVLLDGTRSPAPAYDAFNSPPCVSPEPEFTEALDDAQATIDGARRDASAEWR